MSHHAKQRPKEIRDIAAQLPEAHKRAAGSIDTKEGEGSSSATRRRIIDCNGKRTNNDH